MSFKEEIINICGTQNFHTDEPLKKHTSFRIGGPTKYFITPSNEEELEKVIKICSKENVSVFILGNGTNVLASDDGYDGAVIQIYKNFNNIDICENTITAGAGVLLSALANAALEHSLCGLEFASGIPGTLGGAVTMNAGAYGGEMKQVIKTVRVYSPKDGFKDLTLEDMKFGYRDSIIKHSDYYVLSATMVLDKGDKAKIREKMDDLKEQRTQKQPLEYPSAGSTFKRPEGYFAGKLIMDAGLKGYSVGGAMVSDKHAGFIINKGNATSKDVSELIDYVKDVVFKKFGVELESEVLFLG